MADDDLLNKPSKFNRTYTEAELALFAQYVEKRAACRPAECTYGERCWVAGGPPNLKSGGGMPICVGCGRPPLDHPDNYSRGPRR